MDTKAQSNAGRSAETVTVQTLGCKLNYAETSALSRQFLTRGFSLGSLTEATNVFLLNTCSVTENAERECRQAVRRALRTAPNAFIIVTGCYAQLRPEEIASIDGVDLVLGAKEKFELFERVSSFEKFDVAKVFASDIEDATIFNIASSNYEGERTRAFLKVQDGCDYTCSFCTIPSARGASRSSGIESIMAEGRRLSSEGFREIVLSGVNVGDFGRKIGTSFFELLEAIELDDQIRSRVRISSIEPNLLSEEIIALVAQSSKLCPHFHIPLQSGSNSVLKRMQRRYTRELYESRIVRVKDLMPNAAIGVDVIVGFPGESDEEFEETFDFLHRLDISYLHVFTYSERPDTKAAEMKAPVRHEIRKERNRRLRILSEKKRRAFYASQVGASADVLIERSSGSCGELLDAEVLEGFSENYVRVRITGEISESAELIRVRLGESLGEVVHGYPVGVLQERTPSLALKFGNLLPVVNGR